MGDRMIRQEEKIDHLESTVETLDETIDFLTDALPL